MWLRAVQRHAVSRVTLTFTLPKDEECKWPSVSALPERGTLSRCAPLWDRLHSTNNSELDKLEKMNKAVKACNKYLWSPEIYTCVLILSAELFICTETTLTTNLTQIFSCFCDFSGEWTSVWCMQDKSLIQSIRWTEMHTAKAQKQLVPNLWVGDVRCGRIMKNRITSLITWFWTKRWTPTLLGITSDLKVTG